MVGQGRASALGEGGPALPHHPDATDPPKRDRRVPAPSIRLRLGGRGAVCRRVTALRMTVAMEDCDASLVE